MPLRDDREALRARIEALTGELDDARRATDAAQRELESLRDVAKERDRLTRELGKVQQALDKAERKSGPTAATSKARMLSVALAALGVVAGLVAVLALRPRPADPSTTLAASTRPSANAAAAPSEPAAPWQSPFRLRATVRRVRGLALSAGSACEISGVLIDAGESGVPEHVRLACGGTELYDGDAPFAGFSQESAEAHYLSVPGGRTRALIRVEDIGTRTGRASLRLDSWRGRASLVRNDGDAYELVLDVEPATEPFEREHTVPSPHAREPRSDTLVVVASAGESVPAEGVDCGVRLRGPDPSAELCHARVQCDDVPFYEGFAPCADGPAQFVDGQPSHADRNARIDLDLDARTLRFSDVDANGNVRSFEAAARAQQPASARPRGARRPPSRRD